MLCEAKTFELAPHEWRELFAEMLGFYEIRRKWQEAIDIGKDPKNNDDRRLVFDQISLSEADLTRIRQEAEHDLGVLSDTLDRFGDAGSPEALEYLKQRANSSFFQSVHGDNIRELVRGWKDQREIEAKQADKNRELLYAWGALEVRRCGFELPITYEFELKQKGTRWFNSFRLPDGNTGLTFKGDAPLSLNELKAGLLLARACVATGKYSGMTSEVCNDGLDIINRNWADPTFRETLRWQGGYYAGCLSHLIDDLVVPLDAATLWKLGEVAAEKARQDRNNRGGGSSPPPANGGNGGGTNPNPVRPNPIDPKPNLPGKPDWDGRDPH